MAKKTVRDSIKEINTKCIKFLPNKDQDIIKILEHVLETNETGILSDLDKELTQNESKRLDKVIKRVKKDEPIEYITQVGYFYGNRFKVSPDTLIPRPETEILVDLALSHISDKKYDPESKNQEISVIDVGTGTGCIPISISLIHKKNVKITAVDISKQALKIAKENIKEAHQGQTIKIYQSNLLENVPALEKFDIIIANLPYISKTQMKSLPRSVKDYEPKVALDGGKFGYEIINKLILQTKNRLNKNGIVILELNPNHIRKVEKYAKKVHPRSQTKRIKDLNNCERFLTIKT